MTPRVGLHGRADGRLQAADFESVRVAQIETVKLLSTAAPEDVDRLRAIRPDIQILVRLFADLSHRAFSPDDFIASVLADLENFYASGVRLFEVHNEPNLMAEGCNQSWWGGASFAQWFSRVCRSLKALHPDLFLGWPGLSPGADIPGIRTSSARFLAQAGATVAQADWIGVHCYWGEAASQLDRAGGASYLDYLDQYPGRPVYITEFSNNQAADSKADKGFQYRNYYHDLREVQAAFAFVSSASSGFEHETWVETDGSLSAIPQIVGSRPMYNFVRGLDVTGLYQDPRQMHYADWYNQGFRFGFYEVAIGTFLIRWAREHRDGMRQAGYLTGPYQALHEFYLPEVQCQKLIDNSPADDELPDMLDFERPRLTEAMLRRWCDYHDAHSPKHLVIYTGKPNWEKLVPLEARDRYLQYDLSYASYPYDSPETDAQGKTISQPMDSVSVALRSNPPGLRPAFPGEWANPTFLQHTGHGSLNGYNGYLDLEVFFGTETELRARFGGISMGDHARSALSHLQAIQELLP